MALSCFALQVPDVRVATRVPGLMLERDSARSAEIYFTVIFQPSRCSLAGQPLATPTAGVARGWPARLSRWALVAPSSFCTALAE